MNNKKNYWIRIRMIWRIMQISEDVIHTAFNIHLELHNSSHPILLSLRAGKHCLVMKN